MATTKPTSSTFWTTVSTYLDTISSGLRDSGFIPNTLIAGGEVNTLFKDAFDWIDFFRSGGGKVPHIGYGLVWAIDGDASVAYDLTNFEVDLSSSPGTGDAFGSGGVVNVPGTAVSAEIVVDGISGTVPVRISLVKALSAAAQTASRNFTSADNNTTVTMNFTTNTDLDGPWYLLVTVALDNTETISIGTITINVS